MNTKIGKALAIAITIVLVIGFAGCMASAPYGDNANVNKNTNTNTSNPVNGSASGGFTGNANSNTAVDEPSNTEQPDDSTDQMIHREEKEVTLDVAQVDGKTRLLSSGEVLQLYSGDQLREGAFYRVVADVDYLNGGIAGYVDYPDIQHIYSCKEIRLDDLDLPAYGDEIYGGTFIGDWVDSDILLYCNNDAFVYRNGKWMYEYSSSYERKDGSTVLLAVGVSEKDAEAGIADGAVFCADYFMLPTIEEEE